MAVQWRYVVLIAWSLVFTGCAVVESRRSGGVTGEGVAYMLPMALLPVELSESGGALMLAVQQPLTIGDSSARYVMSRSGNAFSSDNVQVSVSDLGLLESVKVTAEDKTIPALIKLAAAKAKPEAADAAAPTVLYRGLIDPTKSDEVNKANAEINAAAKAFLQSRSTTCNAADEACASIKALHAEVQKETPFKLEVGSLGAAKVEADKKDENKTDDKKVGAAETGGVDAADCTQGICYRVNQPHRLTLTGLKTVNTVLVSIPNGSPTFSLPLERWAFVKTTHDVTLQAGVLKSVTTDRPSSALALASAPVDAASAVIGAVAEIVQLKVDLSQKETALANAKIAEIKAKSDLEAALIGKSGNKQVESAVFGAPSRSSDVVSVTIGLRTQINALANLRAGGVTGNEPARSEPAVAGDGRERVQPGNAGQR